VILALSELSEQGRSKIDKLLKERDTEVTITFLKKIILDTKKKT